MSTKSLFPLKVPSLVLAPCGLPTTWHKLCGHRSFSKWFQQADCYGSALVGEFMVAFLLVFTVLRTESRVKSFGFHEEI